MQQPATPTRLDHTGRYKVLPTDLTPLADALGGMSRAIEYKRQMHELASSYGYSPDPLDWELRVFSNGALLLVLANDSDTITVRTPLGHTVQHTPESLTSCLNLVAAEHLLRELGEGDRACLLAFRAAIAEFATGMACPSDATQRSMPALRFGDRAFDLPAMSTLAVRPHASEVAC